MRKAARVQTAQAPSILIVDDDAAIRELVSDVLTSEGYLALSATNGADALVDCQATLDLNSSNRMRLF
jgi:CheY-like chemotaxis protein